MSRDNDRRRHAKAHFSAKVPRPTRHHCTPRSTWCHCASRQPHRERRAASNASGPKRRIVALSPHHHSRAARTIGRAMQLLLLGLAPMIHRSHSRRYPATCCGRSPPVQHGRACGAPPSAWCLRAVGGDCPAPAQRHLRGTGPRRVRLSTWWRGVLHRKVLPKSVQMPHNVPLFLLFQIIWDATWVGTLHGTRPEVRAGAPLCATQERQLSEGKRCQALGHHAGQSNVRAWRHANGVRAAR